MKLVIIQDYAYLLFNIVGHDGPGNAALEDQSEMRLLITECSSILESAESGQLVVELNES